MAFRPKPPGQTVATSDAIEPFDSHPEAQRLLTLRRGFLTAREERQRQIDLHFIEAEIRSSTGRGNSPALERQKAHAAKLRAAVAPPKAEPAPADGLPPEIRDAIALLSGEDVPTPPDPAEKLKRLRSEIGRLDRAFRTVDALLEELRGELSSKVAMSLLATHRARLQAIYEAAVLLSDATKAERQLVADALTAGYTSVEHILLRPGLAAATRLGTLDTHDSELSFFRRKLENQGVL